MSRGRTEIIDGSETESREINGTLSFFFSQAWKKFDYAQNYILTDETISKWKDNDLCQALFDALRRDYVDFVHLLIEYGASLDKLTVKHLDQLYASSEGESGLPVQKKFNGDVPTRNDYYFTYFPDHFDVNSFPEFDSI